MKKLITKNDLPLPSQLNEEWMNRLEISEKNRRHYSHLSESERNLMEAMRLIIDDYRKKEITRPDGTKKSFINKTANFIDEKILRPGKGKAVDFKHAFSVIEKYAEYSSWVKSYDDKHTALDIIIPYFHDAHWPLLDYCGPGVIQIQITLYRPTFGKFGFIQWSEATIKITELEIQEKPKNESEFIKKFKKNPFEFIDPKNLTNKSTTFGMRNGQFAAIDRLGFLKYYESGIEKYLHQFPQNFQKTPDLWDFQIKFPRQSEIQNLLDVISMYHFNMRVPKENWQLRFDVPKDLCDILASSEIIKYNPYGCFYNHRKYNEAAKNQMN